MLPLEFVLTIVTASVLVLQLQQKFVVWPRLMILLKFLPLVALVLCATVDGLRWQLIPTCCAVLLIAAAGDRPHSGDANSSKAKSKNASFGISTLLISGTALAILVPIVSLPKPTGPYSVGTQTYLVLANNRKEIFSHGGENRQLAVQVWYPAKESANAFAPYMAPSTDVLAMAKAPLWALLASHLHLIKTNSKLAAPLRRENSERLPLIIFSHGLMGGRIQNTVQCEELASHGYIVAGIDHPYDAAFTVFPDGHIVCSQLLMNDVVGIAPSSATIKMNGFQERLLDVNMVLDWLEEMNRDQRQSLLAGAIDTSRIGMMGHSFGGATTVQMLGSKRIKAGVCYDGGVGNLAGGSDKPLLIIRANRGKTDPLGIENFSHRHKGELIDIQVANSGHANFTDLPLLTPVHFLSLLTGSINPNRCADLLNRYTLAFFDEKLKNHTPSRAGQKAATESSDDFFSNSPSAAELTIQRRWWQ